ncbi:purine-nucleoside phosphorylase [Halalkalibacter sp. APA_J-10(15)]|uniref:purine-nucleoside phosphorylase n=1 Tax=Halalkalibacter sp. APA_J-10(15) TaxID=2933805 RepID=UPI001FF3E778|nr:purine-nucleoside phosphorylase [Halalkalibacter sp. APA_J-10(15)]MCK0473810.1 purine-nucleoside phosphorylase [Halalkalibacter sp. APA_J-10(15)]
MDKENIGRATQFLKDQVRDSPTIGLILGSGLGVLADEIEEAIDVPYRSIPHFPVSTVSGHAGKLVFGKLQNKYVVAMQGRFHVYEGYQAHEVSLPVRVMKQLGVKQLIVTNAAGGVNTSFEPGHLMLISDQINQMNQNPLIGPNNEDLGPRFPDMSNAYCDQLRHIAREQAKKLNLTLQEGVYVANSGPSYETPAEVRMIRELGGDAVGMSTVPEVIVARHIGLEVLGITCISNMAAGILPQPLTHEEVIETTEKVKEDFLALVKAIVHSM